jgi:DNA (cytosine-5)-methyltransferase 1
LKTLLRDNRGKKVGSVLSVNNAGSRSRVGSFYPVIDLFAGPGGLGEGFASFLGENGKTCFKSVVSIERDAFSHQTLLLRHFVRHFPDGEVPDEYYDFLANNLQLDELFSLYPKAYRDACESAVQINLGPESHSKVKRLISRKLSGSERWVLVGGPPCQAYSLVGRSRMMNSPEFDHDERHTLYLEYLKIIVDHRPPIFVMENVKGLLSATIEGKSAINRIVRDLSNPKSAISRGSNGLSYKLYSLSEDQMPDEEVDPKLFVVRAEDYGIPQARHRMFIVGIRSDLNIKPGRLRPLRPPTVRQTIGNLPAVRSSLSKGTDSLEAWRKEIARIATMDIRNQLNGATYARAIAQGISLNALAKLKAPEHTYSTRYRAIGSGHTILKSLHDPRLKVLTSHEARGHMASDLRRYLFAATFAAESGVSPKLADFPRSLLPAHQNVELGRTGKMFSDRFRVQLPEQVATTITSHISKDGHYFIHYDPAQCRSLTVREAARLQTFPDNYFFAGPRTAQYHQVGNAVPPQLAKQIAEIIAEVLDAVREQH